MRKILVGAAAVFAAATCSVAAVMLRRRIRNAERCSIVKELEEKCGLYYSLEELGGTDSRLLRVQLGRREQEAQEFSSIPPHLMVGSSHDIVKKQGTDSAENSQRTVNGGPFENCTFLRQSLDCSLTKILGQQVKLQLVNLESKDKNQVFNRKLQSFKLSHNKSINLPETDATSHESESDLQYRKVFRADSLSKEKRSSTLLRLSTTKRNNKVIRHPKGCAKDEDDIDDYPHQKSCVHFLTAFKKTKVRPEENFKPGKWQRKKLVSRDEKIELVADVFLASIDQCSKKAAGYSACAVLAAIIADWLHKNPKSLPLQNQFDELVLEGSLKWRNLCGEENHKAKFPDKHFDLDTVLETKVRSLMVATEKSYVGFFSMDEMPEGFDWFQGEMCFDNIWNNVLCVDATEERIYIVSWNDHFFVLKVEREAIYLIDTLGERLAEGCKQAYIIKFDAESAIYRRGEDGKESTSSQDLVSEGIGCCKEYIKGFLSAIPLRELQKDIKRGQVKLELLHRLLQIDFHCTTPCSRRNS